MKKYIPALVLLFITGLGGCVAPAHTERVTVVKDCTGVYIRSNEKDFKVCNYEILNPYSDGSVLKVNYNGLESCPATTDSVATCLMLHPTEGKVHVNKVEP